jgi:hypothetical protein
MRRRRSDRLTLLALVLLVAPSPLAAQRTPDTEGALFLLSPVGARAVGMGQAVVADQSGSEAVWWNPSGLARSERSEAAIHHSETFIARGDAVSIIVPSSLLGVFGASVNILNFGEQEVTDEGGATGKLTPRNFVYAATYATTLGSRVGAGITYKLVQLRLDCIGGCAGVPTASALTSALDIGTQVSIGGQVPFTIGATVRNMGLRFQVNDNEQADPLPTRLQIGVLVPVGAVKRKTKEMALRLTTDVLTELDLSGASARIGGDAVFQERVHLRAGYVFRAAESAGPSVGLGVVAGNLVLDIARAFEGFSADAGKPPTYLSLRYLF